MFDPYHDAFLYLGSLPGIKYSCIFLLLFCAILTYFLWHCKDEYFGEGIRGLWENLNKGEFQSFLGTGAAYILLIISDLPILGFLHGFDFLQEAAKLFLSTEPLISLIMVVLAFGAFGLCSSRLEYLNVLNTITRILIFVSVASSLLTNQFFPWIWYNIICLILVGVLLLWLKLLFFNKKSEAQPSSNLFDAVDTYDELFPLRKAQADELCRIISSPVSKGISICVAGPWGSGKTSLVNGACDKLLNSQKNSGDNVDKQAISGANGKIAHYEFIFIRALELDSLSSLFHYLFARIREILKSRGAYVGPGSEYRRLIASAGGVISNKEWSTVLEKKLFTIEDDYRSQREHLESLMKRVLNKDKLIIIVDDIERCASEKAREFLYFIKEIATMECCISIFITDDRYLPTLDYKKEDQTIFWDKFFNYHIAVGVISNIDTMKYFEEKIKPSPATNKYSLDRPSTVYQYLLDELHNRATNIDTTSTSNISSRKQTEYSPQDEEIRKKRRDYLNLCTVRLRDRFSRPRTIQKFCRAYYDTYERLIASYKSTDTGTLQNYFKFLQLPKLLFILTFLSMHYATEFKDIEKTGFKFYLELIWESQDEPKKFICELTKNILFTDNLIFQSFNYQNLKQIRFLDTLLTCPQELPNIIDNLTTQEQEWIAAIDQGNQKAIEDNWENIIHIVVQQYPYLDKGYQYLESLIHFSKVQVETGKSTLSDFLQIFNCIMIRTEVLFNQTEACIIPLVSLVYNEFGDKSLLNAASKADKRTMEIFIPNYFESIILPIKYVLNYIAPIQEDFYDSLIDRIDNFENLADEITHFLKAVLQTDSWKEQMPGSLEGLSGLNVLLKKAKDLLHIRKLWNYPDVQNMYHCAQMAMQELDALSRFLDKLHLAMNQVSDKASNLLSAIDSMERILQQPEEHDKQKIEINFNALFQLVQPLERDAVSHQDLQRLHKIVSEYYNLHLAYQQTTIRLFRSKLYELDS